MPESNDVPMASLASGDRSLISCIVTSAAEVGVTPRCEAEATVSSGLSIVVCNSPVVAGNRAVNVYSSTTGVRQAPAAAASRRPALSIERDIMLGRIALVCVTPERIVSPEFASLLANVRVHKVIIDKAVIGRPLGCYSPEHHKFIEELATLFPGAGPAIFRAVNQTKAGATRVRGWTGTDTIVAVVDVSRRYVQYRVEKRSSMATAQLIEWLYCRRALNGVIYCIDQTEVNEIAKLLRGLGFCVTRSYEALTKYSQDTVVSKFNSGRANIAVVQMGDGQWIDREDLGFVIHTRMPPSIAMYLRDTRVADRVGTCPKCVTFHSPEDVKIWCDRWSRESGRAVSILDQPKSRRIHQLERMERFCLTTECRHLEMMRHLRPRFEPPSKFDFCCYSCDNCLSEPRAWSGDDVGPALD